MKLGDKIARLRILEGTARGLGREMTQTEVSNAIRDELGGRISQSYLSQIENGARLHLTSGTRQTLARFFKVHPGYLVDDLEEPHLPIRPRRDIDEKLDLWLIDGAEEFRHDGDLNRALLDIAKHERSRDCLILLAALVRIVQAMSRREHPLQPIELVGTVGKLTIPIREGGTGEVVYVVDGKRRCSGARSDETQRPIPRGTEVVITRYDKGIAYVCE